MLPASEPSFDLGSFVGCVVIHDDMDIEPFGNLSIDLFEKVQELSRPVTLVAFANDKPRGDIERGEQRGRTVPHIAVRATFGYAGHHWQDRLLAIKGLDLALLVDAKDEGSVGRGKIKANDVTDLVDEKRIARQLERLAAVRLQAERCPHPADGGVGKASLRRHRADRPVRRVGRSGAQRPLDHGSNLVVVYRSRSAGANLVKQTIAAILQKSAAPLANRMFVMAKFGSHLLARQAVCASQNDPASFR